MSTSPDNGTGTNPAGDPLDGYEKRVAARARYAEESRRVARLLLDHGLNVRADRWGTKKPFKEGISHLSLAETRERFDELFPKSEPRNVALALGMHPSGEYLYDVDNDCPEACAASAILLPPTFTVGRASKPGSRRLYGVKGEIAGPVEFRDPINGGMLVEVKGTKANDRLTVFGAHEGSGELIGPTSPDGQHLARVTAADLARGVARVAGAALLARNWPKKGGRHAASLALAGWLLRAGWSVEDTETFVRAVCTAAGDEEVKKRVKNVKDTADAIATSGNVTGLPSLIKLLGGNGGEVASALTDWLGIDSTGNSIRPFPVHTLSPAVRDLVEAGAAAIG
jgi:hypothetical protein